MTGWRSATSNRRWGGVFRGLAEHVEVVDVVRTPRSPGLLAARVAARASRDHVTLSVAWRTTRFRTRSLLLEPRLRARDGEYDVLLQLQTLHSPGLHARPYAICTDSNNALMERHDPTARDLSRDRARRWQALERSVARGALFVFTYSEFVRRSFIEDYGCSPERVVVSGGGSNSVLPAVPDRSGHRPRALFVGYNLRRKGGLTLLEAWAKVERKLPDAELVIAGPKSPIPARARNVRWLGRVSEARAAELYREASVFVLPSLFEPFGLVLLEAMGNGLPVVASNCCAIPEMVADGQTGVLVPPGDAGALAEALVRVLSEPDRAAALGREGHAKVLAMHTWGHVGARIARPLLTLADGGLDPDRIPQ